MCLEDITCNYLYNILNILYTWKRKTLLYLTKEISRTERKKNRTKYSNKDKQTKQELQKSSTIYNSTKTVRYLGMKLRKWQIWIMKPQMWIRQKKQQASELESVLVYHLHTSEDTKRLNVIIPVKITKLFLQNRKKQF